MPAGDGQAEAVRPRTGAHPAPEEGRARHENTSGATRQRHENTDISVRSKDRRGKLRALTTGRKAMRTALRRDARQESGPSD